MKSMKISNSRILPLLFLPILLASCTQEPQPIAFGHDTCSVCVKPIDNPAIAALAVDTDGVQFNYDSIECLVEHLGQEDKEMAVIKVADHQHPGVMLNALQSHYKLGDTAEDVSRLTALRHNRANTICWKELKTQILERSSYFSQNTSNQDKNMPNNRG